MARPIDKVAVKGKEKGLVVYEARSLSEDAGDEEQELVARCEEAFTLYLDQKFQDAAELLRDLQTRHPDDRPIAILLKRCEGCLLSPPHDRDGVIRLSTK